MGAIKELKLKQLKMSPAHSPVKKRKRRTLEQKTAQQLIKEADKWWSRYVRLRDSRWTGSKWVGECICCGKALLVMEDGKWKMGVDCGHFISRGIYSLRFDELNTHLQSGYCNAWRDKEAMLEGYRKGLGDKCGADVVKELKRLSTLPDAYKRPKKPELLQIIADCKAYVEHALANPGNYA